MNGLTQEQKDSLEKLAKAVSEAVDKIVDTANTLYKWIKNVISKIRESLIKSWDYLKAYIMKLPHKQRYKLLKSLGIKDYIPFFRRDGVIRCRNNC